MTNYGFVQRGGQSVTSHSWVTDGGDTRWVEAKTTTVSQVELSREAALRRLYAAYLPLSLIKRVYNQDRRLSNRQNHWSHRRCQHLTISCPLPGHRNLDPLITQRIGGHPPRVAAILTAKTPAPGPPPPASCAAPPASGSASQPRPRWPAGSRGRRNSPPARAR